MFPMTGESNSMGNDSLVGGCMDNFSIETYNKEYLVRKMQCSSGAFCIQ